MTGRDRRKAIGALVSYRYEHFMPASLFEFLTAWSSAKNELEAALPFDNSLLHVGVGYLLYRLILFIEKRDSSPVAWCIVLGAAIANELIDILVERWPNLMDQLIEGLTDIGWTMALPTVALAIASRPSDSLANGQSNKPTAVRPANIPVEDAP